MKKGRVLEERGLFYDYHKEEMAKDSFYKTV